MPTGLLNRITAGEGEDQISTNSDYESVSGDSIPGYGERTWQHEDATTSHDEISLDVHRDQETRTEMTIRDLASMEKHGAIELMVGTGETSTGSLVHADEVYAVGVTLGPYATFRT